MVYSPREDSFLLQKQIKKFSKGKEILDMGSGSGIQALTALKAKAKSIIAVDIDKESINCLKSKKIPALISDLFSNINKKFDLIIFNPPYLPLDEKEDKESQLATTGGEKGDEIILRFLSGIKAHLKKNGFVLIVISSLTPKKRIEKSLSINKIKREVLSKKELFMETLEVWKLFF